MATTTHSSRSTGSNGRGIIPPVVTPLKAADELDIDGLKALIEHLLTGGVHGLFILGTTGEAPALSYRLREQMIGHTCRFVAGRVPVLVGVTDSSLAETLKLAAVASAAGASGLVVAPPFYFPPAQSELLHYYKTLSEKLPLPFYLYNMPGLTKVSIGEPIITASLGWDNCLGLKDSSGDLLYFKRAVLLAEAKPEYRVLLGPEELLAESLLCGGDGGVSGGANLFPQLYVGIFDAAQKGDFLRAARLQRIVLEVSNRIYRSGDYGSPIIQGIKTGLKHRGICDSVMSEPFLPFSAETCERINTEVDALLRRIGEAV